MEFYFDKMKIRNREEFATDKFIFVSYEDFFMGEWIGNINVFDVKTKKMLQHTTTEHALSISQLKEYASRYTNQLLLSRF